MVAIAHQLRAMAERFMMAVLTTNSQVGGGATQPLRAALGDAWQNQPHKRLCMTRAPGEAGMRVVEQTRCTTGPAGRSATVTLRPDGVREAEHAGG